MRTALFTARRAVAVAATTTLVAAGGIALGTQPAGAATNGVAPGDVLIADTFHRQVLDVPADGGDQFEVGSGFDYISGVAVDSNGNVFVVEEGAQEVQEVPADGSTQRVVAKGLDNPTSIAVDHAGNAYVQDIEGVVRIPAGGGSPTRIARLSAGPGIAVDAAGNIFVLDRNTQDGIREIPADGSAATRVGELFNVTGLDTDIDGDLLAVANGELVRVTPGGQPSVLPHAAGPDLWGLAIDGDGSLLTVDGNTNQALRYPAAGGPATVVAGGLSYYVLDIAVYAPPPTLAADTPGTHAAVGTAYSYTYTAATAAHEPTARFRVASGALPPGLTLDTSSGTLSGTPNRAGSYTFAVQTHNAVAGTTGPSTTITVSAPGTIFVADKTATGPIVEIAPDGTHTTIGHVPGYPWGVATDNAGDVFVPDYQNGAVVEIPADGRAATTVATGLPNPIGVTTDPAGNLYVTSFSSLVKVTPDGTKTRLGDVLNPAGAAVDRFGNVFIAVKSADAIVELPADGGPPTTVGANLFSVNSIAVDASDNLFVSEYLPGNVVEIPGDGSAPVTVASDLAGPSAAEVDAAGTLYIDDYGTSKLYTVGPDGTRTLFSDEHGSGPAGLAVFAPPPTFTAAAPPSTATVGTDYSYTFTASVLGNQPAAGFGVAAGSPPPGLSLDAATGVLSGTPTTSGAYTFTPQTFNAHAWRAAAPVTIVVAGETQAITVTSTPPSPAYVGGSYTPSASAPGGPVNTTADPSTDGYGTSTQACTTAGDAVSLTYAGQCVLDFDQSGNTAYSAAQQMQQSFAVSRVPSTVTVRLSSDQVVLGEDATAKATVTSAAGTAGGTVQFAVDGSDVGSPVPVASDGTAASPSLLGNGTLAPRSTEYHVTATYVPTDPTTYAGQAGTANLVVAKAATTTTLHVGADSLAANVSVVRPGAGTPTGTVTFYVDGEPVGSAALVDGTATLPHAVSAGHAHAVSAQYAGDDNFTGSSDSTARQDPTITAHVSSAHPRTGYGWYRAPVTVTFTCTAHGAPLTHPCPAPVTLTRNGAGQSVTRTVTATDGGMATVVVSGIDIDRTAPSVHVAGVRNGTSYAGSVPTARCAGSDSVSGLVSCRLTSTTHRTRSGETITYAATAVDRAGNTRRATSRITVRYFAITGARYAHGAYTVRRGHTYTLVALTPGHARPRYVDAAPHPRHPYGADRRFHAAGRQGSLHRWVLGVTMERRLRSHRYWNIGVRVGHTVHVLEIRVIG